MSFSKLQPTYYNSRSKITQLKNTIANLHDLACGCYNPLKHIGLLCLEECQPTDFEPQDKKLLQKCLGITEDLTTKEEDAVDFGDLEKLFEETTGEDAEG